MVHPHRLRAQHPANNAPYILPYKVKPYGFKVLIAPNRLIKKTFINCGNRNFEIVKKISPPAPPGPALLENRRGSTGIFILQLACNQTEFMLKYGTMVHHRALKAQKGREMSVLLDRLDPVEERRVDQSEDGEAAAHDGAQLREDGLSD